MAADDGHLRGGQFDLLNSATVYFVSGECPDRVGLALELDAAMEMWGAREACKDYQEGRIFDERMREQKAPRPESMLIASIVLGNKEGYDLAANLIGSIESDAYYTQKWDLGISGRDLGDLHSAEELVRRALEWKLGKAGGEQAGRMMEALERLDPAMAKALRK